MSGIVQFNQLMQDFLGSIGLPREEAEGGLYRFDIDGQQQLAIGYDVQDDCLVVQSDLGMRVPATQAVAMLQANAVGARDAAVFTAITVDGTAALVRHVDLADLTVQRLDGLLEDLVMRGDAWRERLAAADEALPAPAAAAAPGFAPLHLRA